MTYNYYFDIAAIVADVLLLVSYYREKHLRNSREIVLKLLFLCTTLTPIFDILGARVIEQKRGFATVMVVNLAYYFFEQAMTFLLFMFFIVQLEMRSKMHILRKLFLLIPMLAVLLITVSNPWNGLLFTYQDGVYHSGPVRTLVYIIPMFYFFCSVVYCFSRRKVLKMRLQVLVYLVTTINVILRIHQYVKPQILVQSFAMSMSMLLLTLFVLNGESVLDSKTGLASRAYLAETVNRMIYNHFPFASILVRIADYDLLTTSYGMTNAEQLMVEIALYLQTFVPRGLAFQVSNNCFVLNISKRMDCVDGIERKIYDGLMKPWIINGTEMTCSAFVSAITYPQTCSDMESYNAYLTYFQHMHRMRYGIIPTEEFGIKDRIREEKVKKAIDHAIHNKSFEIYYQPICTAKEQRFMSSEALIRLTDENIGPISPGEFIPLAEANGTIIAIGTIVLEKVCEFIHTHNLEEMGVDYIEVNLSTIQCLQRNFMETLEDITTRYQVQSHFLCFEITETAANCAPAIFSQNLESLKAKGYRLALDDFGTGYANLMRLTTSDFDLVKFDKDMIQRTCEDEKLRVAFEKMLLVFHSIGAKVVAEGVETQEQYEFLREADCDYIQGYYFSKPIPETDYVEFHNMRD